MTSPPSLSSSTTPVSTLPTPVLVATQDAAIGRMIAMALRLEGYGPHLYTDGQQTLEALLVEPCAAAILDTHLPTIDGLAISEHMRASTSAVSTVPIILLLVEEDTTTWQTTWQHLQVDATFIIPFQVRDLVAAVAAAIEHGHPRNQHQADEPRG